MRLRRGTIVAVALATLAALCPFALTDAAGAAGPFATSLVSSDASGAGTTTTSWEGSVSDDGRYVAFVSHGSNLVPGGPTDGQGHVYRKDRATGALDWIDAGLTITEASQPEISGDGQHIVFTTSGATSSTIRWSAATETFTTVVAEGSHDVSITDDGQQVLFVVDEPALDPEAAPGLQAYLWDGSTTRLVSRPPDSPGGADQPISAAVLSGDGSTAVVETTATNLVDDLGPTGGRIHLYRIDVATTTNSVVDATTAGGLQPVTTGSSRLAGANPVSDDGRTVAFITTAGVDELIPGTTDTSGAGGYGNDDAMVYDVDAGYRLLSRSLASPDATCTADFTGASGGASVDDAGDQAVFTATCDELRGSIGRRGADVYRLDLTNGASVPEHLSTKADGTPIADDEGGGESLPSLDPGVSGDGLVAIYTSRVSGIDPGDPNNHHDVFAIALEPVAPGVGPERVSSTVPGGLANGASRDPSVSDDGRFVAFLSSAPNLTTPAGDGSQHAYVKDRLTGAVSVLPRPADVIEDSALALSGDGNWVAIAGVQTGGLTRPVWMVHRESGALSTITSMGGDFDTSPISELAIDHDGTTVATVFPDLGAFEPVRVFRSADVVEALATTQSLGPWNETFLGEKASGVALSGDGNTVVWTDRVPQAPGLVLQPRHDDPAGDGAREVYAYDLDTDATRLVSSELTPGTTQTVTDPLSLGHFTTGARNAVSNDGSTIVFTARSTVGAFEPEVSDHNGSSGEDVVVAQLDQGTFRVASVLPGVAGGRRTCPSGPSVNGSISDDGLTAAFMVSCFDAFGTSDWVVARQRPDLDDGLTQAVSIRGDNSAPDGDPNNSSGVDGHLEARRPVLDAVGALVAWDTEADLNTDDTNGVRDVYAQVFDDAPTDADGDGSPVPLDCNDADASIHPGATEDPADLVDQNCDGFLDEILIPASGAPVQLGAPFADEVAYAVTVDGTFVIGGPGLADAEYAFSAGNTGEIDHCFGDPSSTDIGVGFDVSLGSSVKVPDWGPFATDHVYEIGHVGTGDHPLLRINDCGHSDNSGNLRLRTRLAAAQPKRDSSSAIGGIPVDLDVLVNDEGTFDPGSLAVVGTDVGSAVVEVTGDGPLVRYTAPSDFTGIATVTYSITGSDGVVVSTTASVDVSSGATPGLDLSLDADEPLPLAVPTPVRLSSRNSSTVTLFGQQISVRSDTVGVAIDAVGSADPSWSCAAVGGGVHTCDRSLALESDTAAPDLDLTVTVDPAAALTPCEAIPDSPPCVRLVTWNGSAADEPTAAPAPVVGALPVATRHLTATLTGPATVQDGEPATWTVDASNPGASATFEDPVIDVELAGGGTFDESDSIDAAWTCTGAGSSTARCTYDGPLEPGDDLASLDLTFIVGAGHSDCAAGATPCVDITVRGEDGVAPEPTVVRAEAEARVVDGPPPPDVAVGLTHSTPVRAGGIVMLVGRVANLGPGAADGGVDVTFELPPGLTPIAANGKGWTCSVDAGERTGTCTRDAALGVKGVAPLVSLRAELDLAATPSIVAIEATIDGDGDATNDRVELTLPVEPAPVGPNGVGALGLDLDGPESISEGQTVRFVANLANNGDEDTAGPTTFTVLLPDGLPGGQRLSAEVSASGWTCRTTRLRGMAELRCTHRDGVAAGKDDLEVPVDITADELAVGGTISLPFQVVPGGDDSRAVATLRAVPRGQGHLAGEIAAPTLRAGRPADVGLVVTNRGNGATTGPLDVDVPAPAGTSITGAAGRGWSCTVAATRARCTNPVPLRPDLAAEPLILALAVAAGTPSGTVPLTAALQSSDAGGAIEGRAEGLIVIEAPQPAGLTLRRAPLTPIPGEPTTDGDGRIAYELVVRNTGPTPMTGDLTVTETVPRGATITGTGTGWTCATAALVLTCQRSGASLPGASLGPAATAPAIRVALDFPSSAAGTSPLVLGTAWVGRGSTVTSPTTFTVPAAPPPAPRPVVGAVLEPTVLTRGADARVRLSVDNLGPVEQPAGLVVGALLPSGSNAFIHGPGASCLSDFTSQHEAVVCTLGAPVPAGGRVELELDFTLDPGAPDEVIAHAGRVAGPAAAAVAALSAQGHAPLIDRVSDRRAVIGVIADAGDDREVFDLTEQVDGSRVPTRVSLDGTRSSGGDDLELTWVQTSGPAVDWVAPSGTTTASNGSVVPTADGTQPAFEVPRLRDGTSEVLTFELVARNGSATGRDTVRLTLTAFPNRAPRVDALRLVGADPTDVPTDGTRLAFVAAASDPDGDRLTYSWRMHHASTTTPLTSSSRAPHEAVLAWPAGAELVVVEVTVDDGRQGQATRQFTVGTPPPPLTITIDTPTTQFGPITGEAPPAEAVTVPARVTGADPNDVFWRWSQVSGPTLDPLVLHLATGPELVFDAPAGSFPGDAVVLQLTGTRGSGPEATVASARVTIQLQPLPPPTVFITGPTVAPVGQPATLQAVGSGVAPLTFQWSAQGAVSLISATDGPTVTYDAPTPAAGLISVTVTDATGRTATNLMPVLVGSAFTPSNASPSCADASTMAGRAFDAAAGAGFLAGTLGPVTFDLGELTVTNPCGSGAPRLAVADATVSVAGGMLSGTDLTGFLTEDELCIDDGTLRLPDAWGLTEVVLGPTESVCLSLDPGAPAPLTGSVSATGLPFLPMPDGVTPPTTTLTFTGDDLRVVTDFALPTGGDVHGEVTVDLDSPAGSFDAEVEVDGLVAFGQSLDLTGSVTGSAAIIDDFEVRGSLPGPIPLVPGTELRDLEVAWTPGGLSAEGEATIGGEIDVDLAGLLVDAENWSLSATGQTGAPLTPLPDLTIDPSGFVGTIQSVDGQVDVDVRLTLAGAWSPVDVLTVEQLSAQLSTFPPPSECVGVAPGEVWLAVGGAATVDLGAQPIEVSAQACVGFSSGAWTLSSTASFDSWRPVDGIDVTVEDLGLRIGDAGGGITIDAFGSVQVLGVSLGAHVFFDPVDLTIVVDGFGDLSSAGVGLPPGTTGHIVLASADVPDFQFDDPLLADVDGVTAGLGLYAGFAPDPALGGFLSGTLGLPPVTSLVLSAQLSGTDITLEAAIALGGGGVPLFEVCGASSCTPEQVTSLRLTEVALSISLTGRIGLAASGPLHLPASPDGQVPESELDLTAEIAIDLAGPAITLALYTSDGTWNGALGVPGLDLADLAIQGGVNFASPVPTPTVGFGATIVRLPDDWAELIGADPDDQEPMSFVLNISQTAPILALNIGVEDGDIALRPLTAVGQADALEVDYAKLVIAPFGGTVGPYTFSPGLSMGFAAVIMDVPVDVSATISVAPPLIEAAVSVGTVPLGGITVNGVSGTFRIDANGLLIDLDGSLTIPNGPEVEASVLVEAGLGGVTADFHGEASDWNLASLIQIDELDLTAHADLPTTGAPATFSLGVDADATVLTVPVGLGGTVLMQGSTLQRADFRATVGSFRVGPSSVGVAVTGKGCDGVVGGPAGDGACVQARFDNASVPAVTGSLAGEITVAGIKSTISGSIDGTGVSATGSLAIPSVGSFAVSGRLYSGPSLAGLTDTLPSGVAVPVQNGDLKMKLATAASSDFAGFDSSLKANVGRLGGTSFVAVDGTMSLLGNTVASKAQVSVNSAGKLKYHLETDLDLDVAGYDVADAHVVIDDVTGVDAAGEVSLGDIGTLTIAGGFTPASGGSSATYHLSVDTNVDLLGLSLATGVDLEDGNLLVDINLNGTVFDGGSANVRFQGEASTTGRVCANASVELAFAGTNPTGSLAFCNKAPQRGFKVTLAVHGYTLANVAITVPDFEISKRFGPYGGSDEVKFYSPPIRADLGAGFDFDVEVTISVDDGLTLDGSGSASAYYEIWVNEGDFFDPDWKWRRFTIGSISISIDEVDRSACGNVNVLGLGAQVCV